MNRIDEELLEAARENNVPEVLRLLRAGADLNAKSIYWTPLIVASLRGHVQVVNELLVHGAYIEVRDNYSRTPLHLAVIKRHLAIVNELVTPNENNGATTVLDKRKSRGGANIEAKDRDGDTPLHDTSRLDYLDIVKYLLSRGAHILAANNDGLLPIDYAVSHGRSEMSKYVLQQMYARTPRRLPLHKLLEDLTWIVKDVQPLRTALDTNVLRTDDVVEIIEYLSARTLNCSVLVTKTVHYHST
jgi:ankyrin repeat protein